MKLSKSVSVHHRLRHVRTRLITPTPCSTQESALLLLSRVARSSPPTREDAGQALFTSDWQNDSLRMSPGNATALRPGNNWVASTSWSTTRGASKVTIRSSTSRPSSSTGHSHQPVRDVLDYKGRDSAHAAGLRHHQHQFGERVRAIREPARLRADKSGNCELHERAREADDQARHSRQRRGTRSVLDSAAGHPADRRRKTCRSSGSRCRWVALGSPPKLHRFTWNSHPRRRAT